MTNLMVFIGRLGFWLYTRTRLNYVWYKLYEFVWERNKTATVKRFDSLAALVDYTSKNMLWVADGWRQLWDAFSTVEHIQWRLNNDPSEAGNDCDEWARYRAFVINRETKENVEWAEYGITKAYILTVCWYGGYAKGYGGHNVCLLAYADGTLAYTDYGYPNAKAGSIEEVTKQILGTYAGIGTTSLGWTLMTEDLHFVKGSWE